MVTNSHSPQYLDEKSGASLKLTILNPEGRGWLMLAGGGASVIFSETVCDMGTYRRYRDTMGVVPDIGC